MADRLVPLKADGTLPAIIVTAINTLITSGVSAGIVSKADATALAAEVTRATNAEQTNATAMATKAPLASPTFTGTVAGITKAMVGLANVDNISDANKPVSTAQQAAINAAVSNLVASSPAALDTLSELAAALGNDANFATTVTNALATKVNSSTYTAGMAGKVDTTDTRVTQAVQALPPVAGSAATAATALTKGQLQTFDTSAGTITNTALPALSTLSVGDSYGIELAAGSNVLTQPFAAGDTTLLGSTSASLSMRGKVTLRVSAGAGGVGKVWEVVNHVRSDAVVASAAQLEAPDALALKRFRQALANVDTAPLNWLAIGDSLTEGSGATGVENTACWRVQRALQRDWTTAGKGGFGFANTYVKTSPDLNGNVGTPTPRAYWTFTGGTAGVGGAGQSGGLMGNRMRLMGVNETATLTFVGTGVDLHYTQGVTTAKPFTYSVDGGAAVTVTPATTGGTSRQGRNTAIRGLASGTHTVAIVPSSSSDASPLLGATAYDGDETTGIRFLNDAQFGLTSTAAATGTTNVGTANYLTDIVALWPNPALVTINLGTNDPANSVDAATTAANVQTIIANVKAKCTIPPSFLLIVPSERGTLAAGVWAPYVTALRAVAAADPTNVALLDLSLRLPDPPTAGNNYNQGLGKSDSTHFLDAGYKFQAQLMLRRLLGDLARAA